MPGDVPDTDVTIVLCGNGALRGPHAAAGRLARPALRRRAQRPRTAATPAAGAEYDFRADPLITVLTEGFRPPKLPLSVHVFSTPGSNTTLRPVWGFYARRGVHCQPLFDDHLDFIRAECAPRLGAAVERALLQCEARVPGRTGR